MQENFQNWAYNEYMTLLNKLIQSESPQSTFDSFPKHQKYLYVICDFFGQLMNGGIEQYFLNSAGDEALLCLEALSEIGAMKTHNYLSSALDYFPNSRPAINSYEREKQIEHLWSQKILLNDILFYEHEDNLFPNLYSYYIEENK